MSKIVEFEAHHIPKCMYLLECAGVYQDGAPAIVLRDASTREQWAKLTVCVPNVTPEPGAIILKDWSENDGVIDGLLDAGVITPFTEAFPVNRVTAYLCWLTDDFRYLDPRTHKEPMAAE